MFAEQDAQALLGTIPWAEGREIPIIKGPYRHTLVILCSEHGRQEATFADGEKHRYFGFMRLSSGMSVVPVLPDGRLLMIVEQRPAQGRVAERPHIVQRKRSSGGPLDLRAVGPYSSLEFPGGATDPADATITIGALRELKEETEAIDQKVIVYRSRYSYYSLGSDVTTHNTTAVVFLSTGQYASKVKTDGGLTVLALTPEEVRWNINGGVIVSAQAGVLPWHIYLEAMAARESTMACSEFFVVDELDLK